ncbi:MAG: PAS domain-containing protein, partial [Chloroflexi bacterium]|nr:PAS domain-containing protein [Chloroflexota bacterium]
MALTYRDFLSEDKDHAGVLYFGGARMALLDIEAGFWGLRRQVEALVGRRLTDIVLQQAGVNGGASFARAFAPDVSPDTAAQALRDCIASYQAAGFGQFEIEVLEWPFGKAQDRPIGRVLIRGADTFEAWMMRQHGQKVDSPACAYTAGVLVGFVNVLAGRHDVVCIEHTCQAQGDQACLFELLPADAAGDVPVVALAPDPALGRQLNLLEMLFDRMPMGIAILDRDYYLRRYNPTWASFADRYSPPSARPVAPGVDYFEILPGAEPIALPLFERVLAGETVRQEAVRLEVEGIVSYWDVVLAPLVEDGTVTGILNVCTDATNHVQAQEALKESESKFRLLFEESADAMLLLDGDVFVDCNQAAVEMMRCSSKDQLLFLNPHDISPEKQPDGRLSSEKATDLIATAFEEGSLRFEWVHRTADGTDLPVEV